MFLIVIWNIVLLRSSLLLLEIVEEDLWKFFEKCGTIKYIHIDRPLNAQSYQAQVHFKV